MSRAKTKEKTVLERKPCSKCTKPKRINYDYYMSYSIAHADGRLPICKQCIADIAGEDYKDIKTALRMVDRPWLPHLWESAIEDKRETIGAYFVLINAKDFRHMTWADSVADQLIDKEVASAANPLLPSNNAVITEQMIDKWGYGYTLEEYQQFERRYKKLINNYGEKTALHTENLLTYIRFRVKEEMATARGDVKEAKEWGMLASKAATDARINVSQLSKSDISGGVDVLSQLFEAVESEVGVIPLLPKIMEQPYDDADIIIWATVNYNRRLEDKPKVSYRDIWNFYDEMLEEHFKQQGFNEEQIKAFKEKRNNVFRDLESIYIEPLYESDGD